MDIHYDKYVKYKLKYLKLKDMLAGGPTPHGPSVYNNNYYEPSRIPSYCDRIIYKGNNIKPIKYETKTNKVLCKSDHLLVYGAFTFNGKQCLIVTFNIDNLDAKEENYNSLKEYIYFQREYTNILLANKLFRSNKDYYDMIIYCFQESASTNILDRIMEGYTTYHFKNYNLYKTSSSSMFNMNVRLYVYTKIKPQQVKLLSTLSLGNWKQRLVNSKAAVGIVIDGLCIVGTHFPIDTSKKDPNDDYMGNSLRIDALHAINKWTQNYQNIIIAGDLNFRCLDKNCMNEQLARLIKQYKEFGKLDNKTCKMKSSEVCKTTYKN
jgi:hypothetical protein